MDSTGFLTPVIILIIWTMMVWAIMYARRLPAMRKAHITPDMAKSPDGNWKSKLSMSVQAPAHNYNHLMEQPTIFYAFMFWALLSGVGTPTITALAWVYVGLRVVHSGIQISTGPVIVRFAVFAISTGCLLLMIIIALLERFVLG